MNERQFLKMVVEMGKTSLDDFLYKLNEKNYAFTELDDDGWDDEGKYQYKNEKGQLIESDDEYTEIQRFNFGVSRSVQRSGSYFSEYDYTYGKWIPFEMKEVLIPEVIIPEHIEIKEIDLVITADILNEIANEKEMKEEAKALQLKIEEEEKIYQEEIRKKYSMNDYSIIQKVNKNFKKQKKEKFTIREMQKEYFRIVESEGLKGEDWLEYHRKNTINN